MKHRPTPPQLQDVRLAWESALDDGPPAAGASHVLRLSLNRPDARNAYTLTMVDELVTALDWAEAQQSVRALVLTGAGSAFSAGGDLRAMRDKSGMFEGQAVELRARYLRGIQRVPRRFARFHKPIIAAVNGPAVGAGLDLACMADVRIAGRSARFGSTFVKVGLVPGDGGAWLLPRTIGFAAAMELILTGRLVDSAEALALGLVHAVVEDTELLAEAAARAARIASLPPLAVQLAKAAVLRSWEQPLDAALELAASYQAIVQNTQDHAEAVAAFLEKRDPRFLGC